MHRNNIYLMNQNFLPSKQNLHIANSLLYIGKQKLSLTFISCYFLDFAYIHLSFIFYRFPNFIFQHYYIFFLFMRALMKGNAAQYFAKKEKQKEDPEEILNQIEAKIIAKYIGIQEQELPKFSGFFQQIVKIKLPAGFQRILLPDKVTIVYVNELTGDEDLIHPSIDIIKIAFYKILADSAVNTFSTKTYKLLPFVQQKMVKQCIGLSSKRRQAQKTNVQRDENGKVVMSKLARIKPDLKGLISTRSYMLKALVQKIYTKKQIWGKGKKAGVYAAILSQKKGKKNDQQDDDQEETQQTLQFYEKIYLESKKFYEKQFGEMDYIPEQVKNSRQYFRSTPQSVLMNLGILNIEKSSIELYWLARLMQCLPLPPGWVLKVGDTFDKFYYEPKKLLFDFHPSYIYILEQMNKFKEHYTTMDIIQQNYYNNLKEMTFYDFFRRPYNLDLFAFVEKANEGKITKKKAIKKSQQLGRNDWMAMEGIKNSDLDLKNAVLIENILEYWKTINCRQDNYIPAISPFGQVIWSSTVNERTLNYCPHANILKVQIEKKSLEVPQIKNDDLKKWKLKKELNFEELIQKTIPEERINFLQHYIRNDPKPLSQAYEFPQCYEENQYYSTIFTTPFDLQSELKLDDNEVPLWLQKVHAKKNTQMYLSLLINNPNNFQQIKKEFKKYTLDMIRTHEPSREDDIIVVIEEIKSIKELKNFIMHINDLDGRQERKRLAALGVVEEPEDSFASSISQIQMQGQDQQKDSSQDDLIDIQGEQTQSEKDGEKSVESQEQKEEKIIVEEEKPIEQVPQQQQFSEIEPQKYNGKIYEKDETIERLSIDDLDKKLLQMKKQLILKHKYSSRSSSIKETVQKLSSQLFNSENRIDTINRKRNLLISRFDSQHSPYKVHPTIKHIVQGQKTLNMKNNSQIYQPFRSQCSQLGNEEVIEQIREYLANRTKQTQQNKQDNNQKKVVDETKQTIELQPIKRLKPDINEDPRLRHISQLTNLNQFRKTFNKNITPKKLKIFNQETLRTTKNTFEETLQSRKFGSDSVIYQKNKVNSIQKLGKPRIGLNNQGSSLLQNQKLIKSHSVLSLSRSNNISPTKLDQKFNRVCLGNTASSLLTSQPLMKKGDLVMLQARKSLLTKGRGIETMISKKY